MASPPFTVKAIHEYKSPHDDDLSFPNGQLITVTEEEDADWYVGEYTDAGGEKHEGLFPRNFVERYEPAAPPRPSRARPKKEPAPPAAEPEAGEATSESTVEPATPLQGVSEPAPASQEERGPVPQPEAVQESKAEPPKPSTAKAPPPVSEKPSSFRDRIAAFNKPSAAPVAPIKPGQGGGTSTGFIKKPFVAPPPARNSYVPPPREAAPTKIYRRDEDPEIAARQQQDLEDAERAGLATSGAAQTEGEEEIKTTSLKDRIALLQKQQQEQAARRADASQKEKPKRPPKKRTDSSEPIEAAPSNEDHVPLERADSYDSRARQSMDSSTSREIPKPPLGRRPSREPRAAETVSDGNEADQSGAGDTTEEGDASSTEVEGNTGKSRPVPPMPPSRTPTGLTREAAVDDAPRAGEEEAKAEFDEDEEEEDDEEDDSMDEETRRKLELRQRMAKMSGGMGMPGMFAMPPATIAPKKKRPSGSNEQKDDPEGAVLTSSAQRVPMIPISGLPRVQSPEMRSLGDENHEADFPLTSEKAPDDVPEVEESEHRSIAPARPAERAAPSIPTERPLPPALPSAPRGGAPPVPSARPAPTSTEGRPMPPAPPAGPRKLPEDLEGDAPPRPQRQSSDLPSRGAPPPVPGRPDGPRSPPARPNRASYAEEPSSPTSPVDRPQPRTAPPIPQGIATMPPAPVSDSRPPPPPPPTAAPSTRQSTGTESLRVVDDGDDGESDYEGDYDTDIASGASHKNALNKVQEKQSSIDSEDAPRQPSVSGPPPIPTVQRGVPPPPPNQSPGNRASVDVPRAPPPAPPTRDTGVAGLDYDPYSYQAPTHGISSPTLKPGSLESPLQQASDPSLYSEFGAAGRSMPPIPPLSSPGYERAPPPPPPGASRPSRELPRKSMEAPRQSMNAARASTEPSRSSLDHGQIAQDVDLAEESVWWSQTNNPPPVFQNRNDLLCEFEDSTTSKRGGRTTISRDVYVLFQDYSQTIITARFDPKIPSDATLEQRHEPPPRLRKEQLEDLHSRIGSAISAAASAKQNSTIGDGTAHALVVDLVQAQPNALLPVGNRAYGALVYANMANATVQQYDEIRPGDIIAFRNAKFSGKHGAMHGKYSEDVGKPDHVGIVTEWDGTKKKVRALEQGRENRKAKIESFRVGDLKSGEIRIFRAMDRSSIGWESGS